MASAAIATLPAFLDDGSRTPSLTSDETDISLTSLSLRTDHGADSYEPDIVLSPSNASSYYSHSPLSGRPKSTASSLLRMSNGHAVVQHAHSYPKFVARMPITSISSSSVVFELRMVLKALRSERVLASLLQWLSWNDFFNLARTSRDVRALLQDSPLTKKAIFDRFVPGHKFAAASWDPRLSDREPATTLSHLTLLMLSGSVPLHIYANHALQMISSAHPPDYQGTFAEWLQSLTLSYSRFVLLLRFRSFLLPFHESWLEQPSRNPSSLLQQHRQQQQRLPHSRQARELVFPAPLSFGDIGVDVNNQHSHVASRSNSIIASPAPARSSSSASNSKTLPSLPSSSASVRSLRKRNRLSVFGGSKPPLKPPPLPRSDVPPSVTFFSNGPSSGWRRATPSVAPSNRVISGALSENEYEYMFLPPRKPWKGGGSTSSSSSSINSFRYSPSNSAPKNRGPHDLASSTIRTRAPVLRVFVPCDEVTGEVLLEIDRQLVENGLRKYLLVGDVICNLGYVPRDEEDDEAEAARWLVFNGERLVPLENSTVSRPIPSGFPSPFYHSTFLYLDPIVRLRLPITMDPPTPLTLTLSTASLPSSSFRVKKYTWLTRMFVDAPLCVRNGIGEGWCGEWVLEGEGTKEGKWDLECALAGREEMIWEVMGERCKEGRLWMRLLTQSQTRSQSKAFRHPV